MKCAGCGASHSSKTTYRFLLEGVWKVGFDGYHAGRQSRRSMSRLIAKRIKFSSVAGTRRTSQFFVPVSASPHTVMRSLGEVHVTPSHLRRLALAAAGVGQEAH